MKTLLATLLIALLAGGAFAVDQMGISASNAVLDDFVFVSPGTPFDFYVVLVNPSSATIGGYECSLSFEGGSPFVLQVSGPNGWTNFGSNLNHLCGYTTPLPAAPLTVLSTINALVTAAPFEAMVIMGPANPSSFGGAGPGYSDGANPDLLILCDYTIPGAGGFVGTISTEVVAVEARTLSSVKALFE